MRFRTIKRRPSSISDFTTFSVLELSPVNTSLHLLSYAPVNTSLHLFHQNFSGGGVKRPLNNEDIEDDNTASSGRGGYNVFKTAKEQLVNMIIFL